MLILTRKPGESLYIGDDVKVSIVEIKGHQIRIGIEAPKECRVYREEIYLAILEENKSAAAACNPMDENDGEVFAHKATAKTCSLNSLATSKSDTKHVGHAVSSVKGLNVVVRKKRTGKADE